MDFQELLSRWHISLSQEDILERWSEKHRKYHTISHLEDLIQQINTYTGLSSTEHDMLTLTAIFHDIIYIPRRGDNEVQSAEFFLNHVAMNKDSSEIQEIATMIRDTKHHTPSTHLSGIFSNMDMSIVRRPYAELLKWEDEIRYEYSHLPGIVYIIGRVRFLRQMIKKYPENKDALRKLCKRLLFPWKNVGV